MNNVLQCHFQCTINVVASHNYFYSFFVLIIICTSVSHGCIGLKVEEVPSGKYSQPCVRSFEVKGRTRLEDIEPRVRRRRLALFGHVARMQPGVPAHDALWTAIGACCGTAPGPGWKRPCRRPRTTSAKQLSRDLDGMGLWEAWYLAVDREKWREFATSLCCSGVR